MREVFQESILLAMLGKTFSGNCDIYAYVSSESKTTVLLHTSLVDCANREYLDALNEEYIVVESIDFTLMGGVVMI